MSQDKKQPGVYINVRSNAKQPISVGSRGIVAICEPLSWGPEETFMTIYAGDNYIPYIGYDQTNHKARFLQEIFKGSYHTKRPEKVLLYRPQADGADKATTTVEPLTVTARHKGVRGNDISITIQADPDTEGSFMIQTYVDGMVKDYQTARTVEELKENDWVTFSGSGALEANAGMMLAGGSDGVVPSAAYSTYLAALEAYDFNIAIYDGLDSIVQTAFISFAERLREKLGKKCQVVVAEATSDSEAVISVKNGVVLADGTTLTPQQATWWVGGAEAGANYNESLVYAQYPDAVDVFPRLTSAQVDEALEAGQILFFEEFGSVKVMSDINTFQTYSPEKSEAFCLNQVIRTLDTIANDIYKNFSQNYVGKTQNNEDGRTLLKSWIVGYLNEIQANGGIQNFEADDVTVSAGNAINAVIIVVAIQPVAAIEKIYITVNLTDE